MVAIRFNLAIKKCVGNHYREENFLTPPEKNPVSIPDSLSLRSIVECNIDAALEARVYRIARNFCGRTIIKIITSKIFEDWHARLKDMAALNFEEKIFAAEQQSVKTTNVPLLENFQLYGSNIHVQGTCTCHCTCNY